MAPPAPSPPNTGTACEAITLNLADEKTTRALPGLAVEALGRLDVVVNAAAFVGTAAHEGWTVPFEEQSSTLWRDALEINLTSAFVLSQAAAPLLRRSGHGAIVNIASIYGVVGPDMRIYEGTISGNPAAYAASKGGLLQLTRWMATVLAPDIRVNAVTPAASNAASRILHGTLPRANPPRPDGPRGRHQGRRGLSGQ